MWRLNIRKMYLDKIFQVKKFFLDERPSIEKGEPLLLQIVKQDEPGRFLGRVAGMLIFEDLVEDDQNESKRLYDHEWKYAIIFSSGAKFHVRHRFNLEAVIGEAAARKYYGQREAVKFSPEDEVMLRERLSTILSSYKFDGSEVLLGKP